MGQIARAVKDAAEKAGKGLAKDFADAYHGILKDTEKGATKVAENAAENEAKTVEGLAKSAEHDAHAPHVEDPHAGGGGGLGHPGEGGEGGGSGREQVADPHEAGRGDDAVCGGGEPVDMATGRMFIDQTDVLLPGSLPLRFTRCFESGYGAGRWMGRRWVCTFDERLEIDGLGVVHLGADRVSQAYPHPEPGTVVQASAGRRLDLGTDSRGRVYTLTDRQQGLIREFTVQPDGRIALLTRVSDRSGRSYALEYDRDGTPLGIDHSGGYSLRVAVADGRITELWLAGGAPDGGDQLLLRYGYTGGHLTQVWNSSGLPMVFANDAAGRITSWTDRNGSHYRYLYDERGRVVDEGGADGSLRFQFRYGEPDPETGLRVNTETNALGHTTQYHVNARSQIVAEVDPLGNTTHYERDEFHRLLTVTDPLGRTTRFAYDESGDLITVTRPDGAQATAAYDDALSLPLVVGEPDGTVWHQSYDAAGRRISLTDPMGAITRFHYDERGHLASVTDVLGTTLRVECDAAGLPIRTTDPNGATVGVERDAFGRPVAVTDQLGAITRMSWTAEGLPAVRTSPDGSCDFWKWDGEGNLLSHTDKSGQTTTFEYTHFETLASRTTPDGASLTFRHDAHMQLTAVTDPLGRTWGYDYDPAGRVVGERDFHGRARSYELDAAGQMTALTDSLGIRTTFAYDALGRMVSKDADGRRTTYAYDAAGHLVRAANPDAELMRTYDPLGHLLAETVNGRTLTHTRDALGRRTRRTTPAGHVTTWGYDPSGRAVTMATTGGTLEFVHDAAGRERSRTVTARTPSASPATPAASAASATSQSLPHQPLAITRDWDSLHRLTGETVHAGESVLQRRAYRYQPDGNLAGLDDLLSGARSFDLDPAGRVTAVSAVDWTETYTYDPAGNLTDAHWPALTGASQPAQGARGYSGTELVTAGKARYEYDAAGRMTLRQVTRLSRKPDTWRFAWDAEDRLTHITTPDGARWRYAYDPLGRRISKSRLAEDNQSVLERTDFTWDGPLLAEQTATSPHLPGPHTLSWDHQGLHPLAQTETITAQDQIDRRFFAIVTDLVGTPTELIDPQTSTIAWRAASTLWGSTTWTADCTTYTPLRFPGQYFDPETRLHYNLHRYYDPETARYATPDPLGLLPGPNPDAYVTNPHTWSDPYGLSPHPNITAGNNFKAHYLKHRSLLEKVLGKNYPKWKEDEGATFRKDLEDMISSGRLNSEGLGTFKVGHPAAQVFRGEGLTLLLRQDGEFWTLLESGAGMDTGIQML
ncbi:RHS repeat-associated core domain-containing protein [Streptacidiphilus anmyonensis]|uniref:RHS repeat-associated core domain-containing protein n=1 Tax=Streptacidiphilus anmyonensis TaxID=405782 RepID=UPI000AB57A1E|nr:RHS repeat-associated core domain-containing protein [Streptacidiphilus anmyonensis]